MELVKTTKTNTRYLFILRAIYTLLETFSFCLILAQKPDIKKEDLDKELDQYMANTRTALDKDLDVYMTHATNL